MNTNQLKRQINDFLKKYKNNPKKFADDLQERKELIFYYQNFSNDKILNVSKDDIYEYISKLWAMFIWGNKHYVIDNIIDENGRDNFCQYLADLIRRENDIEKRWDTFRTKVKGMGLVIISEILCKTHPNEYMLCNRRAFVGLNYLKVDNLQRYDYQLTGKVYKYLCDISKSIAKELRKVDFEDSTFGLKVLY